MPLPLPQLDDRTWKDLVEESQALIPSLAPDWTNFNASDPGITLVELFAYLTETLLYRVNRISEPSQRAFLTLINGPAWQSSGDLNRDIRSTLDGLHHCHRAVTAHDFESLAMAVNEQGGFHEKVARAHCLPGCNLESGGTVQLDAPGHVSVLILGATNSQPSDELLRRVRGILEPARLIATRVHVVPPRFFGVRIRITLTIPNDAVPEVVRKSAAVALSKFFDPLKGGPNGCGWPFGRDVYVSEIYQILARLPGVTGVSRTVDRATQRPLDELVVGSAADARLIRNRLGELEAVDLYRNELVSLDPGATELEVKYQSL